MTATRTIIEFMIALNFGIASFLGLRMLDWFYDLGMIFRKAGWAAVKSEAVSLRSTPQWLIRAGTLLLIAITICLPFFHNPVVSIIILSALCALLSWRWLYYVKDMGFALAALVAISAVCGIYVTTGGMIK
jgi:hypothetical protein